MKKIAGLLLYLLLVCLCSFALANVAIDETNFPDDNFRAFVKVYFDKDGDGSLNDDEITAVTQISIGGKDVASLKGVEFFPALEALDCAAEQLIGLDVSRNTALKELHCEYNQLTGLDVSGCVALEELYCQGNQLTGLNLGRNIALKKVWCFDNQLTWLDVGKDTRIS